MSEAHKDHGEATKIVTSSGRVRLFFPKDASDEEVVRIIREAAGYPTAETPPPEDTVPPADVENT